jgi:hypothetical protein
MMYNCLLCDVGSASNAEVTPRNVKCADIYMLLLSVNFPAEALSSIPAAYK